MINTSNWRISLNSSIVTNVNLDDILLNYQYLAKLAYYKTLLEFEILLKAKPNFLTEPSIKIESDDSVYFSFSFRKNTAFWYQHLIY